MRGTFFGLEIGRTGLTTAQFGLDVTSHNIANVDAPGYTRQRIVQTAYDPFSTIGKFAPVGQGLVGGGTRVQILDQIRSAYLDRRFRTESTNFNYWDTRTQSLSYIESFFDNVNEKTSINTSIAEFFKSMNLLATDTISGAPRTLMQTSAMDLVQQLKMVHQGLIDLQESENRAVQTKTEDINILAREIAELNKAIYGFEITGMIANDLRDKRNVLVDKLAEYIDIEYREYPDPVNSAFSFFEIKVADVVLVDHDYTAELGTRLVPNPIPGEKPVYEVCWVYGREEEMVDGNIEVTLIGPGLDWAKITGGMLKAHVDVRDGNETRCTWNDTKSNPDGTVGGYDYYLTTDSRYRGIPYYVEMINDLARALVQEINAVHVFGWTDNPLGSQTGVLFFHEEPEWVTWTNTWGAEYRWNPDENGGAGAWAEWDSTAEEFVAGGTFIYQNELGQFVDQGGAPIDLDNFERHLDVSQITAANIDLSEAIKYSAFNIACSTMPISRAASNAPEETVRGNNENILKMYNIFSRSNIVVSRPVLNADGTPQLITDPGDPNFGQVYMKRVDIGSFDDYGTVIRFDLGNTLKTASQTRETSRILTLAAENQRTAIAGVSLDEEMVGLVKFQHAYNGAARVITAMDDALDRLINGTGRVGL